MEYQQKHIALQEQILLAKEAYQKHFALKKQELDAIVNNQRLTVQKQELALQHHQQVLKTKQHHLKELIAHHQDLLNEKKRLAAQLQDPAIFNQNVQYIKTQFEKRRAFYQAMVQRGNWSREAMADLDRKQKVIHDHQNPSCPLCEQLLTVKRKQFLGQKLDQDQAFLHHQLDRISTILKRLKELLLTQHDQVQKLTKQAELQTQLSIQLTELDKKIIQAEQAITLAQQEYALGTQDGMIVATTLQTMQKELASCQNLEQELLRNDTELTKIANTISQLEQEKTSLPWSPETSQALQKQLSELTTLITNQQATHQSSQEIIAQQQERKHTISAQCKALKELKQIIQQQSGLERAFGDLDQQERQITHTLTFINQQVTQLTAEKDHALHTVGSLEYENKRIGTLKIEYAAKQLSLNKLDAETEDYQALAIAFSKNGIQALLIEEAIPEIEHEANNLLSRLTNNQAQIFIESLRDLKSGGVKETLDIQIADAAGIRPYEMYSGGEAFRVDFALRIAISKLLARRAGTALQTLIIDEGFGSQDEDGLGYMMDALYAIQADFSKIIVVSHLPEFKHNFPVHFIVEKEASGSTVKVEARG